MPARHVDCPEGVLSISDVAYFWDCPITITLARASRLVVRAEIDEDTVVRVRFEPEGSRQLRRHRVGDLVLDFSIALVCDRGTWSRGLSARSADEHLAFQDAFDDRPLVDSVALEGCPDGVCFRAAAGPYEVFELRDGQGGVVGAAIVASD
ncbi:MAG: hypothetical protein H6724_07125 [Sandaracinus sp.]|nr:hypothetical protein [Sandaracinus sp.]